MALHPGLGTPELQTIEPDGWSVCQADFDFAISTEARAIIEQEGIILISYRPLQAVWRPGAESWGLRRESSA